MASLGLNVLLITSNVDRIGHLSCNPSVGGLGKGQLVREIDALGGMLGRWSDAATIQSRLLNASRGPAVQAPRAQVDRRVYLETVRRDILRHSGIWVIQDLVASPLLRNGRVSGVRTELGRQFECRALLLAAGTFTNGLLHIGERRFAGGRLGDEASTALGAALRSLGVELGRFMTGTTPRLAADSIDFSAMQAQYGDLPAPQFSFSGPPPALPQLPCHLTWTTPDSHKIITANLRLSPMYNGAISGTGPRYCLAIEDKIAGHPERNRHQIFVEPEGLDSAEVYPNGIHTGLPLEVQQDFLRLVPGLERSQIVRPGYAVEYDYILPTQLKATLEMKNLPGLWSAGQINGSSGYEEAAAQGLWSGLNIFCALRGQPEFLPGRQLAYMAVLVDDMVTRGVNEPYRMFTSRAERRLLLRHSNADSRLTPLGRELGLVKDEDWRSFRQRQSSLERLLHELRARLLRPDAEARAAFAELDEPPPEKKMSLAELLRRPGMNSAKIARFWPEIMEFSLETRSEAESSLLYAGYLSREEELARRQETLESVKIDQIDYSLVSGLSRELTEKLGAVRPGTLGQAGRIPGMTPAALNCIEIHLKKLAGRKKHRLAERAGELDRAGG
jgi:tRNA uridine 5-carboxymethylaminomethyl modification enzyme